MSWRCKTCGNLRRPAYNSEGADDMTVEQYREQMISAFGPARYFQDVMINRLAGIAVDNYRELLRAEKELRRYNIQTPRDGDRAKAKINEAIVNGWRDAQTGVKWPGEGGEG